MKFSLQYSLLIAVVSAHFLLAVAHVVLGADNPPAPASDTATAAKGESPAAPQKVDVEPLAGDEQIAQRLTRILEATGWFDEPSVSVKDGVVFLDGMARTDEHKTWATDLGRNTQDVVAVVNRMEVTHPAVLDFKPALRGLTDGWRTFMRNLPFLGIGLAVLLLTLFSLRPVHHGAERLLERRITIPLIRDLTARTLAIVVFLVGLYLVLKVSGTTQLALTVLGGTGLLGLVIGIAFRDITENFLASIFLSMQRPFQIGDLVEIVGVMGYIDRLTIRTTVIVSLDGNYVQIPNATVYKNTIRNFTNNPKRRDDFALFVPYDKPLADVQAAVLDVVSHHPAVLAEPEPWVLVDRLNPNTAELRVYFWIDCLKSNWLTVRSSVIRLSLHKLRERSLLAQPGPSQIVFPQEVPVRVVERTTTAAPASGKGADGQPQPAVTEAEGSLADSREQLKQQVEQARPVEAGPDLLKTALAH